MTMKGVSVSACGCVQVCEVVHLCPICVMVCTWLCAPLWVGTHACECICIHVGGSVHTCMRACTCSDKVLSYVLMCICVPVSQSCT